MAWEDADNLFTTLDVLLTQVMSPPLIPCSSPLSFSVSSWFSASNQNDLETSCEDEFEDSDIDEPSNATQVYSLITMDVLYSKDAENRLLSLACTAVAITIDDTMTMNVFFHQLRHSIVLITGNKICSQDYPDPTPQKLQHMNKFTLRWLTLQYVLASWFITTCQRC